MLLRAKGNIPEPPPVMTATRPLTLKRLGAWIDVVAILKGLRELDLSRYIGIVCILSTHEQTRGKVQGEKKEKSTYTYPCRPLRSNMASMTPPCHIGL